MVLSGYLFAKLLDGRRISYPAFFWNRFIRLAPLLVLVFILVGLERTIWGGDFWSFLSGLHRGFIFPVWPNGGWSVTTEIHFYLALPLLLYLSRRHPLFPLVVLAAAMAYRFFHHHSHGEVQSVAYWTILGRIDQFVIGMVAFFYADRIRAWKSILLWIFGGFIAFWWWFDASGGFYQRPSYPSPSQIWIWLPTLEGLGFASLILWYDSIEIDSSTIASRIAQKLGEYSYSIYLLHFFFVFRCARYIDDNVMDISNFYLALAWSVAFFLCMLIPGFLSFKLIERPFLKLRVNYLRGSA
jgi:peptidoglycan/LPS O-acetylase OafA/YrhL